MKKYLSLLLSVACLVCLIPINAFAETVDHGTHDAHHEFWLASSTNHTNYVTSAKNLLMQNETLYVTSKIYCNQIAELCMNGHTLRTDSYAGTMVSVGPSGNLLLESCTAGSIITAPMSRTPNGDYHPAISVNGGIITIKNIDIRDVYSPYVIDRSCSGIRVVSNGTANLIDSSVTGCRDSGYAGVYVGPGSTLGISGKVVIDENHATTNTDPSADLSSVPDSNLYLCETAMVNVLGKLSEGSMIGVQIEGIPSDDVPRVITNGYSLYNTEDPNTFFRSDDNRFVIRWNQDRTEAVMVRKDTPSATELHAGVLRSDSESARIRLLSMITGNIYYSVSADGNCATAQDLIDNGIELPVTMGVTKEFTVNDLNAGAQHIDCVATNGRVTTDVLCIDIPYNVYYYEPFDCYGITYTGPNDISVVDPITTINNHDSYLEYDSVSNKYIPFIAGSDATYNHSIDLAAAGLDITYAAKYGLSYDIKSPSVQKGRIVLKAGTSSPYGRANEVGVAMILSKLSLAANSDSSPIDLCSYTPGNWVNVKIDVDAISKKYDVSINGTKYISDYDLPDGISQLVVTGDYLSTIYYDNIEFYSISEDVVIDTPTDITYSGNPVTCGTTSADINYSIIGDGTASIKWYNDDNGVNGGEISAPSNVGTYWVGVSASAGTHSFAVPEKLAKFNIVPKTITVSGIAADNKVYDKTTVATLDYSSSVLDGKIDSDDVSVTAVGSFSNASAGNSKTVNLSSLALTGGDAGNYVLASVNQSSTTANISPKAISLNDGDLVISKTYNGTTASAIDSGYLGVAGIIDGDDVVLSGTLTAESYSSADAGTYTTTITGYTLSGVDAANYTVPAEYEFGNAVIEKGSRTVTIENPTLTFNEKNASQTLNVSVSSPAAFADTTNITYVSNNTSVAVVDSSGNVTAKGDGSAVITVTLIESNNYIASSATANVTVSIPSDGGGAGGMGGAGGGGGGAIAEEPEPTIKITKFENGKVVISDEFAKAGDVVTIKVIPDNGFKLDSIKVINKNGFEVELQKIDDNTYSFAAQKVEIEIIAIFVEDVIPVMFTDVNKDNYFYDAVKWAVGKGITAGIAPDKFGPNVKCSRAQIMTFLWANAGRPEPTIQKNPFNDIKEGDYYYKAVLWAVENGITSGISANAFGPNKECTRAQAVTFIYSVAGSPVDIENPFTDISVNDYFFKSILWAKENGITAGISKTQFGPHDTCTRGQIVTFMYNAFKNSN